MLQPKRTKYRKAFKVRKIKSITAKGARVSHGDFGLQSLDAALIKSKQIESARKVLVRETKRKGKVWINVFPATPFTAKPAEVKMGKGKGDVEGYMAIIRKGKVLFEIGGVDSVTAHTALTQAAQKLPVRTRVIKREI